MKPKFNPRLSRDELQARVTDLAERAVGTYCTDGDGEVEYEHYAAEKVLESHGAAILAYPGAVMEYGKPVSVELHSGNGAGDSHNLVAVAVKNVAERMVDERIQELCEASFDGENRGRGMVES